MEWSKVDTLKLIELMQLNPYLWNMSLRNSGTDKWKREEEYRRISDILGISFSDVIKKIRHLRSYYNRIAVWEAEAKPDRPNCNWYAYKYLHFMKDLNKPYRLLQMGGYSGVNNSIQPHKEGSYKLGTPSIPSEIPCTELVHSCQPETLHPSNNHSRDEFSMFGEYIANELRSLKGDKKLPVAKKKIQDVIFELKMDMINEPRVEQATCAVYTPSAQTEDHGLWNAEWEDICNFYNEYNK